MALRKRLDRLEAKRVALGKTPSVTRIIFRAAKNRGGEIVPEAVSAWAKAPDGWETVARKEGETESAFIGRVGSMAPPN
jgi:hypothetical protein